MEYKILFTISLILIFNVLDGQNLTLGIEKKDLMHILLYDQQEVIDTIYHHPYCKLSLKASRVISKHQVVLLIESCQIGALLSFQVLEKRENTWQTTFEQSVRGDQQWSVLPKNYKPSPKYEYLIESNGDLVIKKGKKEKRISPKG